MPAGADLKQNDAVLRVLVLVIDLLGAERARVALDHLSRVALAHSHRGSAVELPTLGMGLADVGFHLRCESLRSWSYHPLRWRVDSSLRPTSAGLVTSDAQTVVNQTRNLAVGLAPGVSEPAVAFWWPRRCGALR